MRETCSGIDAALSLEQVRRVVALAQAGTLQGAARQATCSPAEIEAAVVAAEATLGLRLFEDQAPKVRPTLAGAGLLAEMAALLARSGPAAAAAARAPGVPDASQQ